MTNLRELTKIAGKLDEVGLTKEADFLDYVIRKLAMGGLTKDRQDFIDAMGANTFIAAQDKFITAFDRRFKSLANWVQVNDPDNFLKFSLDRGYDYSKAIDAFEKKARGLQAFEDYTSENEPLYGESMQDEPLYGESMQAPLSSSTPSGNAQLSLPTGSGGVPGRKTPTNVSWGSFVRSVDKNHSGAGTIIRDNWMAMASQFNIDSSFNSFDAFYKWLSKKEGKAVTPEQLSEKDYLEYNMAMYSRSKNPILSNVFPGASNELNMPSKDEYFKSKARMREFHNKVESFGLPDTVKAKSGRVYDTVQALIAAANRQGMNINELDALDAGGLLDMIREGDIVL